MTVRGRGQGARALAWSRTVVIYQLEGGGVGFTHWRESGRRLLISGLYLSCLTHKQFLTISVGGGSTEKDPRRTSWSSDLKFMLYKWIYTVPNRQTFGGDLKLFSLDFSMLVTSLPHQVTWNLIGNERLEGIISVMSSLGVVTTKRSGVSV